MKVLIFTHRNDIDGMGNAVLANLAFKNVDYVLCGTFDLTEEVTKYLESKKIYEYDKVFVTDLCLEEQLLERINKDDKLKDKILNLDHHKTYDNEKYTKYPFVKIKIKNDKGLCCGTSLFYEHLLQENLLDENNEAIKEFVELTRQHDTWEWKNIYNNEKSRYLATLFDVVGTHAYIDMMIKKLQEKQNKTFEFNDLETTLINNRLIQVKEKMEYYAKNVVYKDILGLKAGINFITYEYRNELGEYYRENNFDMDFVMMIAIDHDVISYRSVRDNVKVRDVAEYFGGKGHDKAATNPISKEKQKELIKILTRK